MTSLTQINCQRVLIYEITASIMQSLGIDPFFVPKGGPSPVSSVAGIRLGSEFDSIRQANSAKFDTTTTEGITDSYNMTDSIMSTRHAHWGAGR